MDEDNDLGKVARICSQHCSASSSGDGLNSSPGKDGLQLWLDIEYQCVGRYMTTTIKRSPEEQVARRLSILPYSHLSKSSASLISSILALIGLWCGYFIGRKLSRRSKSVRGVLYSSVPTADDESRDRGSINNEKAINFRLPA